MKVFSWLLLFLLVTAVIHSHGQEDDDDVEDTPEVASADEAEEEEETETTEAEGVSTACILPNYQDRQLPAGSIIEVLTSFENGGKEDYSVEYIRAYLTSPMDFSYHVQNFSGIFVNKTVYANDEVNFVYKFRPDVNLDPREYGLVVDVFYINAENETFLSTVFNATIEIKDPISTLDAKTVFAYIMSLGLASLVAVGGYKAFGPKHKPAKAVSAPSPTAAATTVETGTNDVDWDYINSGHLKYVAKRGKSPADTKKKASK